MSSRNVLPGLVLVLGFLLGALAFTPVPAAAKPQGAMAVSQSGELSTAPPPIPIDEIIRRFAAHESAFKVARDNYTYTQSVLIEESRPDGPVVGTYQLTSDIVFTPEGRRYEEITYAPPPTLHLVSLSPQDMSDIRNIQPFVLTSEDLSKYTVQYAGREKLDELNTYVFHVGPKRIEKNQRYFQGTIWVDDQDYAIVKTDGKAVPDIVKGDSQNLFPRFVTYRENIEKNFWFPTYTHADDILHFKGGDNVRIRMTIRYKNYKRFGSTIKLGPSTPVKNPPPESQTPPQQ